MNYILLVYTVVMMGIDSIADDNVACLNGWDPFTSIHPEFIYDGFEEQFPNSEESARPFREIASPMPEGDDKPSYYMKERIWTTRSYLTEFNINASGVSSIKATFVDGEVDKYSITVRQDGADPDVFIFPLDIASTQGVDQFYMINIRFDKSDNESTLNHIKWNGCYIKGAEEEYLEQCQGRRRPEIACLRNGCIYDDSGAVPKDLTCHYPAGYRFMGCAVNFTESMSGQFQSPRYPKSYPNSLGKPGKKHLCQWRITVPERAVLEGALTLYFEDFYVENPKHDGTCFDYVEVYHGHELRDDMKLTRLCGEDKPLPIIIMIRGNTALVTLGSDSGYEVRGFRLTYNVTDFDDFTAFPGHLEQHWDPAVFNSSWAIQRSTFQGKDASLALDGDLSTCAVTGYNTLTWWSVEFEPQRIVHKVLIHYMVPKCFSYLSFSIKLGSNREVLEDRREIAIDYTRNENRACASGVMATVAMDVVWYWPVSVLYVETTDVGEGVFLLHLCEVTMAYEEV